MCLFQLLLWCSTVVGRGAGLNIVGDNSRNSRFGEINSRLGRCEFPFRVATGICRQRLDLARRFHGEMAVPRGKSAKFPVQREKPGVRPRPNAEEFAVYSSLYLTEQP